MHEECSNGKVEQTVLTVMISVLHYSTQKFTIQLAYGPSISDFFWIGGLPS